MPTTEHLSLVNPLVTFQIRTLNVIQRAKRDSRILKERAEYLTAVQNRQALTNRIIAGATDDDERKRRWDAADPDLIARVNAYYDAEQALFNSVIVPAAITAALVSVKGMDGVSQVSDFLDNAPDALIEECYQLCDEASGLTVDRQKN